MWEHPAVWAAVVLVGAAVFAAFFLARIFGFG